MTKRYSIVTDPEYGYLRADPLPSPEEVEEFYRREFYSGEYKRFNDSSLEVQQEEREFWLARWDSLLEPIQAHFGSVEGRSLFDVGFGYAQALLHFRERGFEVSGLEPSPEGAAYARQQGIHAFQANIEDIGSADFGSHDVVLLLNVLEHLRHPAKALLAIRERLLKPGGMLVIDVPNEFNDFQTVADEHYGLGQWWVCPPAHINYFSPTSLRSLLEATGFDTVSLEASFPLELFLLMGEVYVGNPETGKACHEKRVLFERTMRAHGKSATLTRLYRALASADLGRQVTAFAVARPEPSGKTADE